MQYFASHYWQADDDNATSLVLQQAYHKKRRMPVLLACICTEKERLQKGQLITKGLTDWFYGVGLPLCGKVGVKGMEAITDSLNQILKQELSEYQNGKKEDGVIDLAGILCVGAYFQIFQQGRQKISILNSRNHHSNCRNLIVGTGQNSKVSIQNGTIQKSVGIMLASKSFHTYITNNNIEQCLNIGELRSQERLDRHLQELGTLGEEKGGRHMGAVVIVSH